MAQSRSSRGWDDIQPYAISTVQGPSAAAVVAYGSTGFVFYQLADNNAKDEVLQFGFQIPHRWAAGSDVHFHIHVMPTTNGGAGADVVRLKFDYQFVNIAAAFSSTTNTTIAAASYTIGAADADKHLLWEPAAISASGKTLSSALIITVTRLSKTDAADTYTGAVNVLFGDLHVEIDKFGSMAEVTD